MVQTMKINKLPAPTFGWLGMNEAGVEEFSAHRICPAEEVPPEICVGREDAASMHIASGCGDAFDAFITRCVPRDTVYAIPAGKKASGAVRLTYRFACGMYQADSVRLDLGKGSGMTVIMDCVTGAEQVGKAALRTRITAGAYSHLTLVQIIRIGQGCTLVNDIAADADEHAKIDVIHIFLSGASVYQGMRTSLYGYQSECTVRAAYTVTDDHSLDMNYIVDHYGNKSVSNMKFDGTLRGTSSKILRATIDFKNGCAGSVGDETEDALLMDDTVKNKTIPLILCAEEDVAGNHGATIGRLDENLLFYLASRGMEEREIYKMLELSRIAAVIAEIPDEKMRDELLSGMK